MSLNDKIKQILADKNLSPSFFADEIGIQRSSVSHILAGRNKPSLDIVQKIIKRFPELGIEWILDDSELPNVNSRLSVPGGSTVTDVKKTQTPIGLESREKIIPHHSDVHKNLAQPSIEPFSERPAEKKIDRVILFYSDGTFQEFKH